MTDRPKTAEEARAMRYGVWGGCPKGLPFDETRCAYTVWGVARGFVNRQCSRKPGHGPGALYCRQHAAKVEGHA